MIDPIILLKDYTMKGKKIRKEGEDLIFGNIRIPLLAPTAWIKAGIQGGHYTVGAIWLFLLNSGGDVRKYLTEVNNLKLTPISIPDKQIIVDYFTGKLDTVESIDEEFRPTTQINKHGKPPDLLPAKSEEMVDVEERKEYTENELVLNWLASNEKKLATRHTQLQGQKVY